MRSLPWAFAVFGFSQAHGDEPRLTPNVVASAEDAFGVVVGPETLGLYNPSSVRGFSPLVAGNARIDGVYFDEQGAMIDRLVSSTRIRVGLAAVQFPWPAPTGIVDYKLRQPRNSFDLTSATYSGPFQGWHADLDGAAQLLDKHLGINAGGSLGYDVIIPGQTERVSSVGFLAQWNRNESLSIKAFWGRQDSADAKTAPTVFVSTGQAAPHIARRYFGQSWTDAQFYSEHYGLLVNTSLNSHWTLRSGVFHSAYDLPRYYGDLYANTTSTGDGDHILLSYPNQYYGSVSGEIQLSHTMSQGALKRELDVELRARDMRAVYGGTDSIDLGLGVAGKLTPVAPVASAFGPRATDHIHEYVTGLSYSLRWRGRVDFTAGIQRPFYSRHVNDPNLGASSTRVSPWLANASLVLFPDGRFQLFTASTRGLEDSGIAPPTAVNRGAVLAAARSSQREAGLSYSVSPSLHLVAAAFDIQKPYLAIDPHGFFGEVGTERHRGSEISLTGTLTSGVTLVAGAMFLSPEVMAQANSEERIGKKSVGLPSRVQQFSLDYHIRQVPRLSADLTFNAIGSRSASVDNRVEIPRYVTLDVGARYQIPFDRHSVMVRAQMLNVTNTFNWYVGNDGGLLLLEPRRAWIYLVVDF